ncbi:hypothetical protein BDFB_006368 [Asbolus verrucosus]|uniref:Uncharacterized protein n=1 Tax=Asbolus verrucosus TaxID=1661398 RepID=A0A482VZQ2_ASBVE|nr:hypothetical protein BDFB_006368 [Asbolus verrucosus]
MPKLTALLIIVLTTAILQQCSALKCYVCDPSCEVSKATSKPCGAVLTANQEAFCTKEHPKDKESSKAVRGCAIVNKGGRPPCFQNQKCSVCNNGDLCNAAPSVGANHASVGVVTAFFAMKLLY